MEVLLEDSNIQEKNISLVMENYFITDKSYAIAALPVVDHLEEIMVKYDKKQLLNVFKEELFQMLETQLDNVDYAQYRFVFYHYKGGGIHFYDEKYYIFQLE
ncbi:hypothetical protein P4I92_29385 [Bacillus cereus]